MDLENISSDIMDKVITEMNSYDYNSFSDEDIKEALNKDYLSIINNLIEEQNYDDAGYVRDYEIVGMVKEYDAETQTATILQKNRVFEGDEVEVLRPDVPYFKIKLEDMYDLDKNKKTDVANRAHMMFKVKVNEPLKVNDMLVKANNTININNN